MEKHFVTFYSPGTFCAETTTKPIDSWDVGMATKMAQEISERHNATPYGFSFSTRVRSDADLDSHVDATSPTYYLGGEVFSIQDIEGRNDPSERILLSNMRCNKWDRVVINNNSWKWTQPLREGDVVLDFVP